MVSSALCSFGVMFLNEEERTTMMLKRQKTRKAVVTIIPMK